MFEKFVLIALASCVATQGFAQDANRLLRDADRFRLRDAQMRIETQVSVYKEDKLQRERRYTVLTQAGRKSLVLFRSPSEVGQKLLMLGDEFWIVLPTSQRPIRITPMQKLLGDASTGDIASMSWAEDYTAVIDGEEALDGLTTVRLKLTAARSGVSYPQLTLWLAKQGHFPVAADLYTASSRLAKHATFVMDGEGDRMHVANMTIRDEIQRSRSTVVKYLERQSVSTPMAYYNPMYLVRNDAAL